MHTLLFEKMCAEDVVCSSLGAEDVVCPSPRLNGKMAADDGTRTKVNISAQNWPIIK
jgi:hypothetical protein